MVPAPRPLLIALLLAGCGGPAADEGDSAAGYRRFLEGTAAWARCDASESESLRNPAAFDRAIAEARSARDGWAAAAASRDDWPAARRNVERALLRMKRLESDKAAADRAKGKKPGEAPPPPPPVGSDKPVEVPPAGPRALTRAEVMRLLDQLAAMEKEKIALRREHRGTKQGGVEKDW
jgi:hypothetical protein